VYSVLAGVLFANSLPHLIHGIPGNCFPAPFFHTLGKGAGTAVVNVLWGLFNFGASDNLARNFWNIPSRIWFRARACNGFSSMSLCLSVLFERPV